LLAILITAVLVVLAYTSLSALSKAARIASNKRKIVKLEEDTDDYFYTKKLGEKAFDDLVIQGAKLGRVPELARRLAEIRERIDGADKVAGVGLFFVDLNIAKDEQKELPLIAATVLQGEDPERMSQILRDEFNGVNWEDLTEEQVYQVGRYILEYRVEPGLEEYYKGLEELIEEGEDVAISLP
jgi:hypothetical protein